MALELQIKNDISRALVQYMKDNALSQENLASMADINISYINSISRDELVVGKTQIKDSYFKKIAKAIGYRFESTYWKPIETDQFLDVYSELMDAKINRRMKMIIGSTGCGKSYTVNRFKLENPANTYIITVSSLYRVGNILDELGNILGVKLPHYNVYKSNKIAAKLRSLHNFGKQPVLVIDEAENLSLHALKMLKGLYDAIKDYCSIVLIGTRQLIMKIEKLKDNDAEGMPQFYRRFKAGIRYVTEIDKNEMFTPFLENVEDRKLRVLLTNLSDNYGELNDYLEPALREADKMNVELTETFFQQLYKI